MPVLGTRAGGVALGLGGGRLLALSTTALSTGNGGGTGGATPPATPAISAPLDVTHSVEYVTAPAAMAVKHGLPAGPGEVPAGSRIYAMANGARVDVQMDAVRTWPDGSHRFGVASYTLPAMPAGTKLPVTFRCETGARNTAPWKTLDALKAETDFRVRVVPYDPAGPTLVMRLNDLIGAAPAFPWGTNPTMGLDVIGAGPERVQIEAWAVAKQETDGALDKWLVLRLYVDALKGGGYFVLPQWEMSTIYGPHAAGTVGPATPGMRHFAVELYNGATRIGVLGGPDDPRAATVAASTFDAGNSSWSLPAGFSINDQTTWVYRIGGGTKPNGRGIGVGVSGDLPSGVQPGTAYWIAALPAGNTPETGKAVFYRYRYLASNLYRSAPWVAAKAYGVGAFARNSRGAEYICRTAGTSGATEPGGNGAGISDGGAVWESVTADFVAASANAATGTAKVFPLMHASAGAGGIGHDVDLRSFWVGTGPKPAVRVQFDKTHLFQKTRFTPPYNPASTSAPLPGSPRMHTPGEVYHAFIWSIESASDDPPVSRIGFIPYDHARLLHGSHDPVLWAQVMSQGVTWADYPTHFRDERSGMPPVTNNGPAGDGSATYPGMAPLNPTLEFMVDQVGTGSPPLSAAHRATWYNRSTSANGYKADYQQVNTSAHSPNYYQVPYLMTGDRVWLNMCLTTAGSGGCVWNRPQKPYGYTGSKTWRPVVQGQMRGMAWTWRGWTNFEHMAPDNHPYLPVLVDYLAANRDFYVEQAKTSIGRHLGKPYYTGDAYGDIGGRPFQEHHLALVAGMIYWRTGDPGWRQFMDAQAEYIVRAFDDAVTLPDGTPRNGGWLANEYGLHGNDFQNVLGRNPTGVSGTKGVPWVSTAEMLQYSNEPAFSIPQAGPAPYAATGLRRANNDFSNTGYEYNAIAAVNIYLGCLAVWASSGYPDAQRVRKQIQTRMYGTVQEIPNVGTKEGLIPHYSMIPIPGSPD